MLIDTSEHQTIALPEEDLLKLLKESDCKLVENVNFREGTFSTSYFVGLQRICDESHVLFVAPKYSADRPRTNYIKMLSVCLNHPEILGHTENLFGLDFNSEGIDREHEEDLITPLIVVQFLRTIKRIILKGLQKSYYQVKENKKFKVKGKILVTETICRNHVQNRFLSTWCSYEEFGINNAQNKFLKKVIRFISRYSHSFNAAGLELENIISSVSPAFILVDEDFDLHDLNSCKSNVFFSEYHEAIKLGRFILKRFSIDHSVKENSTKVKIPPFWIDMSKLFELYVLGKLKDALPKGEIIFQASGEYGQLDFLRTSPGSETIIDAKYKFIYANGRYDIDNIRQLSAYARDRGLLKRLSIPEALWSQTVLSCLIIHPDWIESEDLNAELLFQGQIKQFEKFYKIGIRLPSCDS